MKGSEIVPLATKRPAKIISTPAEDDDSSDDDSIDEAQQPMGRAHLEIMANVNPGDYLMLILGDVSNNIKNMLLPNRR